MGLVEGENKVAKDKVARHVEDQYNYIFHMIGKLGIVYKILLEDNCKPVIHAPREVPRAPREKLKAELQRREQLDIVERV